MKKKQCSKLTHKLIEQEKKKVMGETLSFLKRLREVFDKSELTLEKIPAEK